MGKCGACGDPSTCRCTCSPAPLCITCFQTHLDKDPDSVHYCYQLSPVSPSRQSQKDGILSELDRLDSRLETETARVQGRLEKLEKDLIDLVRSQIQRSRSTLRQQLIGTKGELAALKTVIVKGNREEDPTYKAFLASPTKGLEALNAALDSLDFPFDEVLLAVKSIRLDLKSVSEVLLRTYFASVSIQLEGQRPVHLSVSRSTAVYTLKELYERKTGISARRLHLRIGEMELEGCRRLEELEIPEEAVIVGTVVEASRSVLYIQPYKQPPFTLDFDVSESVATIKARIAVLMDLPISNLRLISMGRQLKDEETGLKPNSSLFLAFASRQILALVIKSPSGQLFPIEVSSHDTVVSLKETLVPLVSVPAYAQILRYNGKALGNAESLEACGVTSESLVEVSEGVNSLASLQLMVKRKLQALLST